MADHLLNILAETVIDLFENTAIKFSKNDEGDEIKIDVLKGFDGEFNSYERPVIYLTDSDVRIAYTVFYNEGNIFQKGKRKKLAEEAKNSVKPDNISFNVVLHDPGLMYFSAQICALSHLQLNDVLDQASEICQVIIDHLAFIQSLCKQLKALAFR